MPTASLPSLPPHHHITRNKYLYCIRKQELNVVLTHQWIKIHSNITTLPTDTLFTV